MQDSNQESHYSYDPSLAVAIVAAVLYGTAFLLTLIQWIRYKSWVWLTMVIAAASKILISFLIISNLLN